MKRRLDAEEFSSQWTAGERRFAQVVMEGEVLRGLDLTGVDLSGSDLRSAVLRRTCFAGAKLDGALFDGADMGFGKLQGASLRGARLRSTELLGANLAEADLSDADLSGAYLVGADLTRANLRGANLQDAKLSRAKLAHADLSGARLLDDCVKDASAGGANLEGAAIITGHEFRAARLAEHHDRQRLAALLAVDLDELDVPFRAPDDEWEDGDGERDEWREALVFPRYQNWLQDLGALSGGLCVRVSYGLALTTLPFWTRLGKSAQSQPAPYGAPPDYKLEGVQRYLASPSADVLERLGGLVDPTSQDPRQFHDEFEPWFVDDGDALLYHQAAWCAEAVDWCLRTLLNSVMGANPHEPNAAPSALWFCGLASLKAHRTRREDSARPALHTLLESIRQQTTDEHLAVRLGASAPLHRSVPW